MFVIGTAGNSCVLQHNDADKTNKWATLADPAAGDNQAVFAVSDVYMYKNNNKLHVHLPTKPKALANTVALHVSKDGGITWSDKENDAQWTAPLIAVWSLTMPNLSRTRCCESCACLY